MNDIDTTNDINDMNINDNIFNDTSNENQINIP